MKSSFAHETRARPLTHPQMGFDGGLRSGSTGFVIFDDYFAGIRAKKRFKELNPESARASNVPNMWKMDYLEHRAIRKMAVEEACKASLVIISVRGDEQLPRGMGAWLKNWRNNPSRCAAEILAIVKTAETAADPLGETLDEEIEAAGLNYLRREAERSEVPFSFELASPMTSFFLWLNDEQG